MNNRLTFYTIYKQPLDFPDHFVIRTSEIRDSIKEDGSIGTEIFHNKDILFKGDKLDDCRFYLHRLGLCCIGRDIADDPVIVEVWI